MSDPDEAVIGPGEASCAADMALRRDGLFYLLGEAESALERALPGLSADAAAAVAERLGRLVSQVRRHAPPGSA